MKCSIDNKYVKSNCCSKCHNNCNCCSNHHYSFCNCCMQCPPGPKGDTGPQGPQGDTGPQGPQGTLVLSNYLTSRVVNSSTVNTNESVVFGNTINLNGSNISHTTDTPIFTLAAGQTYQVIFSINGINDGSKQGMIFALSIITL